MSRDRRDRDRVTRRWQALQELDRWREGAKAEIPPAGWPVSFDDDGQAIPDPGPGEPTDVTPPKGEG